MDAAEYKHVALGLIFLKYISDRFEERRARALADPEEAPLVDERDLYIGDNVFWVPDRGGGISSRRMPPASSRRSVSCSTRPC
jgi:type I restriction-modification system DNA methylase subunit